MFELNQDKSEVPVRSVDRAEVLDAHRIAYEILDKIAVYCRRISGSGHWPRSVRAQGASTAAASIATRTLLSRASAK